MVASIDPLSDSYENSSDSNENVARTTFDLEVAGIRTTKRMSTNKKNKLCQVEYGQS